MPSYDMHIDPLDQKDPARLAWEEFRASSAAAMLIHWLFRDLRYLNPDYAADLWNRFETGLAYKERLENEGVYDGAVPVHTADWDAVDFWIGYEDLLELYDYLYPHGAHKTPPYDLGRGLVVIALHNGFESYAKSVGVSANGSLPARVLDFLKGKPAAREPDITTFEAFVDLDATRHVLVHNRGVVDERYVRAVRDSKFVVGESRLLVDADVDRFAYATQTVARVINESVGGN